MIIDENSNNSSTFSIFTNKELEQQNYIKQIDFILEKYNILEDFWELISRKFKYSEYNPSVKRLVRFLILK